jgi:hypothetical protein
MVSNEIAPSQNALNFGLGFSETNLNVKVVMNCEFVGISLIIISISEEFRVSICKRNKWFGLHVTN